MPRAKSPESKRRTYTRQPFRLKADARDDLAKRLGIADDESKVDAMVQVVNGHLSMYFQRLHNFQDGPTANSLIQALDPIHRKFIELHDSLTQLDPYSRELLEISVSTPSINSRAVLGTLRQTLTDISSALGLTLADLDRHKTSHRRENWPLRLAIHDLFFTFNHFRQHVSKEYDPQGCRGFVLAALIAAGIPRTNFNRLLDEAFDRFQEILDKPQQS